MPPRNVVGLLDPQVNGEKMHPLSRPLYTFVTIRIVYLISKSDVNVEIG